MDPFVVVNAAKTFRIFE